MPPVETQGVVLPRPAGGDRDEPSSPGTSPHDGGAAAGRGSWIAVALVLVVLCAPLVVALVVLRRTTWFPVLDLAMTELRVRDVGTSRTPLIGLPGRIGRSLAEQGSHPGPLSFYALAPFYRLLGRTAWSLQVGTVAIQSAAMATSLAIARRRGGTRLVLAMGLVLALLTRGYGIATLTEPWNPYLPVLWWFAFLLAVWSVVAGDVALLPVVVIAASFCAQTHVPYLAITAALGALALGAAGLHLRRTGSDPRARRRARRWVAVAAVIGLALWTPPVVEQLDTGGSDGNIARLARHFGDPPSAAVGTAKGVELALLHLDPRGLVSGRNGATGSLVTATAEPEGSVVPGLLLLAVWAASVALAWRARRGRRERPTPPSEPLALHLVVAVALVAGAVSMGRIFGDLWYYLMLWAWGVTALLVLATTWSFAALAGAARLARPLSIVGALATAATVVSLAATGLGAAPPAPRLSATLGAVVEPTAEALRAGVGPADGPSGRYVVTWEDALHIGSQAYGLVSELERRGFTVGMTQGLRVPNTKYRTIEPGRATAEVHFATGRYIQDWRERAAVGSDIVEVAYAEPRSPAEVREFLTLRDRSIALLERDGLDDVVPLVDDNLFGASIDRRVPPSTRELMARMLDLGLPAAVFLGPAGTTPS